MYVQILKSVCQKMAGYVEANIEISSEKFQGSVNYRLGYPG
jgi:hypothetical protein